MKNILLTTACLALISCGSSKSDMQDSVKDTGETASDTVKDIRTKADSAKDALIDEAQSVTDKLNATISADSGAGFDSVKLSAILADQPAKIKARYPYRNPKETLEFFGIEPSMTVVEALPGGGWYSKILLPYLGQDGKLIGVDYALDMWSHFGGFATPEFIENKKSWPKEWTAQAIEWRGENGPDITAFAFGSRDTSLDGTADAALFIRAMHNLNRFAEKKDYIGEALSDMHALLKPGGILGVVQHRAPEDNSAESSTGQNGYLKQSELIKTIEAAGFTLIEASEINANKNDKPSNSDIIWRLPPSLSTSREDDTLKAQMLAIGETDRMTLKFVKQ